MNRPSQGLFSGEGGALACFYQWCSGPQHKIVIKIGLKASNLGSQGGLIKGLFNLVD